MNGNSGQSPSSEDGATPQRARLPVPLMTWAVAGLLLGIMGMYSGGLLFVGPTLIHLAPTLLLLGAALMVTSLSMRFIEHRWQLAIVFGLTFMLFGLNTRLPAAVQDAFAAPWTIAKIGVPQRAALSHPIRLLYNGKKISARRLGYATVTPACFGDGCFITRGFRTPLPHLGSDYWQEDPQQVLREAGFSIAQEGERTHSLEIIAGAIGMFTRVQLHLRNADGVLLSSAFYRYRNGFPNEPEDSSRSVDHGHQIDGAGPHFALHANIVNELVGAVVARTTAEPVKDFLSRSFVLSTIEEQRGAPLLVELEVLAEKTFEPVVRRSEDPWPETGYDDERSAHCFKILVAETPESPKSGSTQAWWNFAADPSRRSKIRKVGREICDDGGLWLLDAPSPGKPLTITRYSPSGQQLYHVAFQVPPSAPGFYTEIRQKTVHEKDGFLYFDLNEARVADWGREYRRYLIARLALPRPPAPPAPAAP